MKARMSFVSLKLDPAILKALNAAGYNAATPVQEKSIPEAVAGFDLMCSAPTGTGKTASFVLPALQKLQYHGDGYVRVHAALAICRV